MKHYCNDSQQLQSTKKKELLQVDALDWILKIVGKIVRKLWKISKKTPEENN